MRLVFGTIDLPDTDIAPRLLERYVDAGGQVLDLANVYRDGEASRAVGRWLARGPRDRVALYAKGCHPPYCRPELVAAEVDKSRTLLGVDWIDVFILHRDDRSYPVSAWADALLAEVDSGRIGALGVSNWTIERTRDLAAELAARSADHLRARRDTPHWDTPANRARRDRAAQLAERLGTTIPAIALVYVMHQPDHVFPVVGTTSEAHLEETLAATEIRLDDAQLAWLEDG